MRTQVRLANRKGLLNGQLNVLQEEALYWIMLDEVDQEARLERERMKYTILAGNAQLWQLLFGNELEDEEGLPRDEDIEWIKPETAEDFENVLNLLQAGNQGGESFNQSSPSKSP